MFFRVETIPHRNRKLFGKCRSCGRHSTFKIKLHKTTCCLKQTGKYEMKEIEVKNKKTKTVEKKMIKDYEIVKEWRPIGNHPYLLCSRKCIVMAKLKFL